ncbi:MAG: HEAT repeat domain-containing protein [Anaerolineae bacterium]|nr:HEAT repeat domain-containing protein [Anaerolineae bacterium]
MASGMGDWLRKLESRVAGVRSHAAWRLGRLRDASAVPALIRVLQSDENEDARLTAAWALGKMGDPVAIPALEAAREHDESGDVQSQAREALGTLKGETKEL